MSESFPFCQWLRIGGSDDSFFFVPPIIEGFMQDDLWAPCWRVQGKVLSPLNVEGWGEGFAPADPPTGVEGHQRKMVEEVFTRLSALLAKH